MTAPEDFMAVVDEQLARDGVSVVTVSDGTMFTFTRPVLERLYDASAETGRVILFVQRSTKGGDA